MSSHAWRNALVYGFVAWTLIAGLCIAGVLVDNAWRAS